MFFFKFFFQILWGRLFHLLALSFQWPFLFNASLFIVPLDIFCHKHVYQVPVAPKPGRYVLILQVWCCVDWWVTVLPGFVDMGWKRATYLSVQWILLGEGGHWAHSKIVQNLLKLNVKIYSHNVLKLVWTRAPWNSDCQWSMLSLRSDVFSEILINVFIFIIIKSKWCCLLAYLLIFYGSVDISELYLPLPHHTTCSWPCYQLFRVEWFKQSHFFFV